ncbi:MAG: flavin reductase family protein [Acidobacteria bacterium]|nr:flavin reductase family protein [Acidobacteriota bacterium]
MDREMYYYEPSSGHGLAHDPLNSIVAPRPIGWISSRGADGNVNLAPYSFFNLFNYDPPIIGFSSNGLKHTVSNVRETGEFCWNMVTRALAEAMNATSASVPAGVSEFDVAGLTPKASRRIDVPWVAESPVVFECRRTQIVQLHTAADVPIGTWLVMGEVVGVHIARDLLADGVYDTVAAGPIARGGGRGDYFAVSEDVRFRMSRPR